MKNPFFLFFLISLIYSCNDLRLTNLTGLIYGTTYNIQFYNSNSENFSKEIDSIFKAIDNSMSTYKPNSIISKINNNESEYKYLKIELNIFFKNFGRFSSRLSPVIGAIGKRFPHVNRPSDIRGPTKNVPFAGHLQSHRKRKSPKKRTSLSVGILQHFTACYGSVLATITHL